MITATKLNMSDNASYPVNLGQRWTTEEEKQLLKELNNGLTVEQIAHIHQRTVGGICSRQRHIAYQMYLEKFSFDEITQITKLNKEVISQIIMKKNPIATAEKKLSNKTCMEEMETKINTMRDEIDEIKGTLNQLIGMIKAIYDFKQG